MLRPFALALTLVLGCERLAPTLDAAPPQDTPAPDAPPKDATQDALVLGEVPLPREPLGWDAARPGPFRVGYRTWSHTYTPAGTRAPRTVALHLWYPTLALDGDHPRYFGLFLDREAIVAAPAAPAVHPEGRYPVHVFSHGDRGFGASSAFLMRYFASHGWVSIAPDHTGNTTGDTPTVRLASIYHLRSGDVTTALDALGRAPVTGYLAAPADAARVVLSGHSFGSHTVWASAGARFDLGLVGPRCARGADGGLPCTDEDLQVFTRGVVDPRVVAAVPMAGALSRDWFGPEGHRGVRVPMLSLSGSEDPVGAEEQFRSTPEVDLTWVDIRGGCHQFFAIGHCDHIPDEDQPRIVGAWVFAFARRHVLRDTSTAIMDITEGRTVLSDRVTVRRRSTP